MGTLVHWLLKNTDNLIKNVKVEAFFYEPEMKRALFCFRKTEDHEMDRISRK